MQPSACSFQMPSSCSVSGQIERRSLASASGPASVDADTSRRRVCARTLACLPSADQWASRPTAKSSSHRSQGDGFMPQACKGFRPALRFQGVQVHVVSGYHEDALLQSHSLHLEQAASVSCVMKLQNSKVHGNRALCKLHMVHSCLSALCCT